MTPTPKLRFVERVVPAPEHGKDIGKIVHILQQWWEDKNIMLAVHITDKDSNTLPSPNRGEWRDIPLEQET
jgi:hypothetical protein